MNPELIEGWLIHKKLSGDTSLHLSFFSRKKGFIHCLYRGGRTRKKTSHLELFTPLSLVINERYDRFYLKNIECHCLPLLLENKALFAALYMNELLYYSIPLNEPNDHLLDSYEQTLHQLTSVSMEQIPLLLRRFEINLLAVCGYALPLFSTSSAGDSFSFKPSTILPTAYYQFIPGHGFERAETGFLGEHLLKLATLNFENEQVLKTAKIITRQAIHDLLNGRQLKSKSLFSALKSI